MTLRNQPGAFDEFHRARRQAAVQEIVARLSGQSTTLLSYDEVRRRLGGVEGSIQTLKDIPLDSVVGSVGRYNDFNRSFLPRKTVNRERWARVKAVFDSFQGIPAIEVYQIGQVYFVQDGNHRVSVARRLGHSHIQAYVKEVKTKVPLTSDIDPDDLIIKFEYAEFIESTNIDRLYPQVDFSVTATGGYQILLQQIEAIKFSLELDTGKEIHFAQAIQNWYQEIYFPIIYIIRRRDLLRDFPDRTETDLFLWISKHRQNLSRQLVVDVSPDVAVFSLVTNTRLKNLNRFQRFFKAINPRRWLIRSAKTGQWRQERLARGQGRLFADILVVLEKGSAAQIAIEIAVLEGAQICGLCLTPEDSSQIPKITAIQAEFDKQCRQQQIPAVFVHETGSPQEHIIARAPFTDLLVMPMKLTSTKAIDLDALLQNCCTPVLVTIGESAPITHALLGYDGSSKAEEALYLAAYMTRFWELKLTVITAVSRRQIRLQTQLKAKEYLDHYGITAQFIETPNPPAEAMREIAVQQNCDLLILGGDSTGAMKKFFSDSTMDKILQNASQSVLICQ